MPITINTYCRINRNGSININTDPRFGVPYSTNLIVQCGGNPDANAQIFSVSIGGGPAYIIKEGSFPVYAGQANTNIEAHQFGGTSITVSEGNNATMTLSINGIPKEGSCANPITGTYTWNYTFTESDIILVSSDSCG